MNFIIGARGRLGSGIAEALAGGKVLSLGRDTYGDWWKSGSEDLVSKTFGRLGKEGDRIYMAAGLIDPSQPEEDHQRVNCLLPANIVKGATRLGIKVITFGTVMEVAVGGDTRNPYFASKQQFGRFIEDFSAQNKLALHLRIHTLFGGGPPDPFMFLGLMLDALVKNREFRMTPGTQLREYHHIDDEVAAILRLAGSQSSGALALSHGHPVQLRELAKYIFEGFGKPGLLRIGALPGPAVDNFNMHFTCPAALEGLAFRETLPAVLNYLRSCEARWTTR